MNKRNVLIGIVIVVLIGLSSYDKLFEYINGYPKDFNFIMSYGVGGNNKIDTFENKFTKDTIEGLKTITLKLNSKEKKEIYDEMIKIDILNNPSGFKKRRDIEPVGKYYLKVNINGKEKIIQWTSNAFLPVELNSNGELEINKEKDDEYIKLENINKLKLKIMEIIDNKNKVKDLPDYQLYL